MSEFMKYIQEGSPAILTAGLIRVMIERKKHKNYPFKRALLQFCICVSMGTLVGFMLEATPWASFAIPVGVASGMLGEGVLQIGSEALRKKTN
jgi:uncharacterized membrane protein YraQ (UPF0718 family)